MCFNHSLQSVEISWLSWSCFIVCFKHFLFQLNLHATFGAPQALYENMLVELPFASFFLSKLLGTSADVDIHHLASLDPEMYRNLLFLKSYEGDVEELGLNFTVVNNDLGEAQVTPVRPPSSFSY